MRAEMLLIISASVLDGTGSDGMTPHNAYINPLLSLLLSPHTGADQSKK